MLANLMMNVSIMNPMRAKVKTMSSRQCHITTMMMTMSSRKSYITTMMMPAARLVQDCPPFAH